MRTVGDGTAQHLDVVVGDALWVREHLGHMLRDAHLRAWAPGLDYMQSQILSTQMGGSATAEKTMPLHMKTPQHVFLLNRIVFNSALCRQIHRA